MSASTPHASKVKPCAQAAYSAIKAIAAKAPKSVLSIPSDVRHDSIPQEENSSDSLPAAVVRSVGTTRRVFVLNSHFNAQEMNGLAYRIDKLSKNTSISSILLSSNAEKGEVSGIDICLPTSALETEKSVQSLDEMSVSPGYGRAWYVSSGYDVRSIATMKNHERQDLLNNLRMLALAIKGNKDSKVPFISLPHGLLTDGGYALAMGSYVLATNDSSYKIMNPLRGLSLDPVGLSYILPRLGWEHNQPSKNYPVGSILGLTGYEASAEDMVETGLATHYIDSYTNLGTIERALGSVVPYEQQNLMKEPVRQYGREDQIRKDINGKYRNRMVANILHTSSIYDASGQEFLYGNVDLMRDDPSLVLSEDEFDVFCERESLLLDIANTFKDIFQKEKSVAGIMERIREVAFKEYINNEEKELVDCAKDLLTRMEKQSPLALKTIHKLLEIGQHESQTLESCMEREQRVQLRLFDGIDFKSWVASGAQEGEFNAWKHKSVKDVTNDEVDELLGE